MAATTLVKNPEIIPKLSEILDLLSKRNKLYSGSKLLHGANGFNYTDKYKKYKTFGRRSVSLLNDSLLNHRFDEAAKVLWIMCPDRNCFHLILYKGIMVVLENLISNHEEEMLKTLLSNIKSLRQVNKMEVQLDYLIYALKNNIHELDESIKGSKRKIKAIPYIQQLYLAYSALMDYITWVNKTQGEPLTKDENDAFHVITVFKKLVEEPGIWDIFVLKLIEILEYYEKYEEIEEILKRYVDIHPRHVNAYIYLCVHLHKYNGDTDLFIHYAKILVDICPSDERVLLLVQKWDELGKYLKKRLKILFMFLDYPVNGKKILGWQLLSSHLTQAASSKKSSTMEVVESSWNLRCHPWNYMHFNSKDIDSENLVLISSKVKVISVLDPNHEYITKVQAKFPHTNTEEFMDTEDSLPTSYDFNSLYYLEDDLSR